MNPSVEAAWIAASSGFLGVLVGVAGTTIVAVVGFRNTRAATEKTVNAAHSERVWDRKADAYQDALTAALWRTHRRMYLTTAHLTDEQYAEAANTLFMMQTEQDWWALQGRLGTFGDPEVVTAYNKTLLANENAHRQHDKWRKVNQRAADGRRRRNVTQEGIQNMRAAEAFERSELQVAMSQAQLRDYELERAIRKDLDLKNYDPTPERAVFTELNRAAASPPVSEQD